MKKNIHDYERVARFAGGAFLSSLAFWGPKKIGFLGFVIPMATGLSGTCPLYSALGISTRKETKDQDNEYFPVQSISEEAAGHPIVGVS
ncbi:MAG: DUF2892 domain-containing protein [Bacteriovoracaceae bacterium]|nr:DUF2892 domain-containing protein [Bacteriovoracaceae bacterium]